jgi:Tol biopolymer transport system component
MITRGNFEIFTMATDGSDVTQVTNTEDEYGQGAVQSFNPTWSPVGLQVAFDGYRGLYEASEVYIIDVDGTDERRLTSNQDQC